MNQYSYGIHTIIALLHHQPERIHHLYIQKDKQDKKFLSLIESANAYQIKISFVNRNELDRLSNHGIHQGVVAECFIAKTYSEKDLAILLENLQEKAFLLILDGVQDPHNLGACLRSADAAGVHAVIAPKDKSVGLTPVATKVACGAAESVPFIQVTNLARTMRFLKDHNIWLMGAADNADKTLYQSNFTSAVGIVLGAEGQGMRRLTQEHCDEVFRIPMHGTVSSLNVSVATGIFLFEVVRQRLTH
jgi:23S rRNA (guanosine2251-2'-O)-methyltransferase